MFLEPLYLQRSFRRGRPVDDFDRDRRRCFSRFIGRCDDIITAVSSFRVSVIQDGAKLIGLNADPEGSIDDVGVVCPFDGWYWSAFVRYLDTEGGTSPHCDHSLILQIQFQFGRYCLRKRDEKFD